MRSVRESETFGGRCPGHAAGDNGLHPKRLPNTGLKVVLFAGKLALGVRVHFGLQGFHGRRVCRKVHEERNQRRRGGVTIGRQNNPN